MRDFLKVFIPLWVLFTAFFLFTGARVVHAVHPCLAAGTCIKLGGGDNFMLLPAQCNWRSVASRQLDGGVETLAYCEPVENDVPRPQSLVCRWAATATTLDIEVEPPLAADVLWHCDDGLQKEAGSAKVEAGFGLSLNLHLFGKVPFCTCSAQTTK